MKDKKVLKGEHGYLTYQRKKVIIVTIIYYAISLAVFALGYYSTHTKANLLTVVAVLGLLPASKSTVSAIMYIRTPKYNDDTYNAISSCVKSIPAVYDLFLTSYQKNYPINCFVVRGSNLMGYTEFSNVDVAGCEEHIRGILSQNSIKNVNLKIFTDKKKFIERINQLQDTEESSKDLQLLVLMLDISL